MKLTSFGWLAAVVAVTSLAFMLPSPTDAYVTSFPAEPDIDGILTTVGLTIAHWFAGLLPYPTISALINAIVYAMTPRPEDDYWDHIETQVEETCGQFINQDNIEKVLVYKDDLIDMLKIYERAPVVSDGSYPDKNVLADAITTSIITNRFLIEAAMMPWSMTLYFVDISSIHLMILKDAADSYTYPDQAPSLWWKDLSTELTHYSLYSEQLYNETVVFRKENIECYFNEGKKFDTYVMTDHVTEDQDSCEQEHPEEGDTGSCTTACQLFEDQVIRTFTNWYMEYVGEPVTQWDALRLRAEKLAEMADTVRAPKRLS